MHIVLKSVNILYRERQHEQSHMIDNNKKYINTELKFDNFPIELITNLIPEKYNDELLKSGNNGLILNGTLHYAINNTNNKNSLAVNLNKKTLPDTKNSLQQTIQF